MKKITYLIASLLLMSMVFSMVGCSSETTNTSSDGNISVSVMMIDDAYTMEMYYYDENKSF